MKRKVKRYDGEEGSEVQSDDSGSSKDYGTDYSESTNPGGSLEDYKPAAKAKPKAKIVSKKELEESGLSLRDYMNKQKGLSRKQPAEWKKRGFAGSETGGDAAVMYRKSMAKGGTASSRADGIASKGHTRGKYL